MLFEENNEKKVLKSGELSWNQITALNIFPANLSKSFQLTSRWITLIVHKFIKVHITLR